jgi:6-phosphogluconolactonase (cycloisomerase 2 family)
VSARRNPTTQANAVTQGSGGSARPGITALYRSVGEELHHFDVDVEAASLTRRGTVTVPAGVQYVWPHPSRQYLYVASSDRGPGATGDAHHLTAFRVDPATGALRAHGEPSLLPSRPIHMSLDRSGDFALTAFNLPSSVTVHRINRDGTIGPLVTQPAPLDTGIYAHQILATPDNRAVILITRGNDPAGAKPEDPGALKVFRFTDGVLSNLASVAPGGGHGFGPRHLDFHPTQPWVYVARERENKLDVYRLDGGSLSAAPVFVKDTLAEPQNLGGRQAAGTVHVHPSGRFVYVANRASATVPFEGQPVFQGGENAIAVYAIDHSSGEPTMIQSCEARGYHVRTFALDASGRVMVTATIAPINVRNGSRIVSVPAGLSVFRVGDDGTLGFVRTYDVETNGKFQWWMGMVGLPGRG